MGYLRVYSWSDDYYVVIIRNEPLKNLRNVVTLFSNTINSFTMESLDHLQQFFIALYNTFLSIMSISIDRIIDLAIDNPMFKIVLAFVPVILSISYPLLTQTISRLNDQFKSTNIIEQFSRESAFRRFKLLLIISVILTFLCFIISSWILLLSFFSTTLLIYYYFRYQRIVNIYLDGTSLFKHLSSKIISEVKIGKKSKISVNTEQLRFRWHSIVDILSYAIVNGNLRLEQDIEIKFMFPVFNYFKGKEIVDKYVNYPDELLNSSYDIILAYLSNPKPDYYKHFEIYVGSIFLPQYINKKEQRFLSPKLYVTIWRNLNLLIRHKRYDKIMRYWESFHQYYRFDLYNKYFSSSEKADEDIQAMVKLIQKNKESFFQFHTALSANIFFCKEYETLKKLWTFTQSQPPEYLLVLNSVEDIFKTYFDFTEDMPSSVFLIDYHFNNLLFEAFNKEPDGKYFIRKYCILMLIRLQFLKIQHNSMDVLSFPIIPQNQSKKQEWIKWLTEIKKFIKEIISDDDLIMCLRFDQEQKDGVKQTLLKYIDDLTVEINREYSKIITNSDLDPKKVDSYKTNSISSIKSVYEPFRRIGQRTIKREDRDKYSDKLIAIRGSELIVEREAFLENTSTHYLNADLILGESISNEYQRHVSNKFYLNTSKKFIVEAGKIFEAVDRMQVDKEIHVLVMFGINLDYYRDYLITDLIDAEGDADYSYKGIDIYSYKAINPIAWEICHVLKKKDLPMIRHIDWKDDGIRDFTDCGYWTKFGEPVDKELSIYCDIIDFARDAEFRKMYSKREELKDSIESKVLLRMDFIAYCWFKKEVRIWSIQEARPFQEGGNISAVEDIPTF